METLTAIRGAVRTICGSARRGAGMVAAAGLMAGLFASQGFAQAPPTLPVPDSVYPNLWLGAVPPNGVNAPVVIFIHGFGFNASYFWTASGAGPVNDMYNQAYAAGLRTAFISMSADNSPNTLDFVTNANMIFKVMPEILAVYPTSSIYFVGQSDGGLAIQAALISKNFPQLQSVKGVFCSGTANQGTPLADWAFGPGKATAGPLGLLTPSMKAMEVASVAKFRAQADPILAASGILFYTLAGTVYNDNATLSVTGPVLNTLVPGVPNDGIVPQTSSTLTFSYSMEMGKAKADNFNMGLGKTVFPFMGGQFMADMAVVPGYKRIATGGFGDDNNQWAWGMRWFKGYLYVGTGRDVTCVISATAFLNGGFPPYPPQSLGCAPDIHDLKLQAEIWRYNPQARTWSRVFQSPNDIPVAQGTKFTAEDIGIRGMWNFTESDGTQALYAAGVSAAELFGKEAPYTTNPNNFPVPRILRSVDGVNWAPLPGTNDPTTFLGNITNIISDTPVVGYRSFAAYNNMLFVTASDYRGEGVIIGSATPQLGGNTWFRASPPVAQVPVVWAIRVFNNFLYSANGQLSTHIGYTAYKTDASGPPPYNFQLIVPAAGGQTNTKLISDAGLSLYVYNNNLYMGTNRNTELVEIHADDTWDVVAGVSRQVNGTTKYPTSGIDQGFGNALNRHFWSMGSDNNGLHMGTYDLSVGITVIPILDKFLNYEFGFDFLRSVDTVHWNLVTRTGMGDGYNLGVRNMEDTPYGFFVGCARRTGGLQVWMDSSVLDYNGDGIIDSKDVGVLVGLNGTKAVGTNDPHDINQDGVINVLDARLLATQCTNPGCSSTPGPPPAGPPAPQNLVASSLNVSATTVSLNWQPSPNAVQYRVYRYQNQSLFQFIQGIGGAVTVTGIPGLPSFVFPDDILAGKLDSLCPGDALGESTLCSLVDFTKSAGGYPAGTKSVHGIPSELQQISIVTTTSFSEPVPTAGLQAIYFVRAEDGSGNLSLPSNIVGGPADTLN